MKIAKDNLSRDTKVIRAYAPGRINVSDTFYTKSLILAPDQVLDDWPPQLFAELKPEHLDAALALEPEILIIGTGAAQHFLPAEMLAALARRGIGVEMMDTAAACRTYNVLLSEDRKVVAALFMI